MMLVANNINAELTTAEFTEFATPAGPPLVCRPTSQAMIAVSAPKIAALVKAINRSLATANDANDPMKDPGYRTARTH